MTDVAGQLCNSLQTSRKVIFLGVGSPLRADDSIGLYIVTQLQQQLKSTAEREYFFYLGESAPENFSGEIRNQAPSHVIVFDAAEMELKPGTFSLIEQEKIGGISFSTHMLPLKILADYLRRTTGCQVIVVGIQPKFLEFAFPMTPEVQTAADQFINQFCKLMNQG